MNKIQNLLLELIRTDLNQQDGHKMLISQEDWLALYSLINEQGLGSRLYSVLSFLSDQSKPNNQLSNNWKNMVVCAAITQLGKIQQMKNIVDVFHSVGFPFIVLKGVAIARFYSHPEYRLMSDLDILVEDEYINLSQQTIESIGYTLKTGAENHAFHLGYAKKEGKFLYIELHYSLLEPDFLGYRKMNQWYGHIWKNKKKILFEDMEFYVMAEEDELINQILHLATHMIHSGARMSHIYDIALIVKRCGSCFDWQYIHDTLITIKLFKFTSLILTICHNYFDLCIPDKFIYIKGVIPEVFLEKFINQYSVIKLDSDKRTWDRMVDLNHPIFCKSLLTLPMVCFIEFFVQLLKYKKGMKEAFLLTQQNIILFKDTIQTFKRLDLVG